MSTTTPHTYAKTLVLYPPSIKYHFNLTRMQSLADVIPAMHREISRSTPDHMTKDVDNMIDWLEHFGAEGWTRYFEECEKTKEMKKKVKKLEGKVENLLKDAVKAKYEMRDLRDERNTLKWDWKLTRAQIRRQQAEKKNNRGDGDRENDAGSDDEIEVPDELVEGADALYREMMAYYHIPGSQETNDVHDGETKSRTRDRGSMPNLRGGSSSPVPNTSNSRAEEFDRIYTRLVAAPPPLLPSITQSWIHITGILQLRNAHLERQLSEYKDLYASAVEDLQWNMSMCADLEESLDLCEDEKIESTVELGFLKKQIAKLEAESKQKDITSNREETHDPATDATPKSFTFYPRLSLIIIPSLPALTLHFAPATNLPQIHSLITRIHPSTKNKFLQLSPSAKIVRDILLARDALGVALPESLSDDAVTISIPEIGKECVDRTVKIAAWETCEDEESGWVEFRERSVERKRDERIFSASKLFGEFGYASAYSEEEGQSVCSCHLCKEPYGPSSPPVVSIRGGYDPDDDDDYDDDEDTPDTDDEDGEDEVEHEDDARDPWEY
jgi:hypothetical protein